MAQPKAPPFTLYEYRPSPFCVAIRIALNECDAQFTPREVDLDKPRTAAFLKRSPFGSLPALVEHRPSGELAVFETSAILLFLAERFPEKPIAFLDFQGKAQSLSWLSFMSSSFAVELWETLSHKKEEHRQHFCKTLEILDDHLTRRAFLAGDYSIADTLATPLLDLLEFIPEIELDSFSHVLSWRERLRARPSYKNAWPHEKELKS